MDRITVFLASSQEFTELRERMHTVEHGLSEEFPSTKISVRMWEYDVTPGFHVGGIQERINPLLDEADIVVAWIRCRIGHGTATEIRRTVSSWRTRRKPRILLYFYAGTIDLPDLNQMAELGVTLRFKEDVRQIGLYAEYRSDDELIQLTQEHLRKCIRELQDVETQANSDVRVRNTVGELFLDREAEIRELSNLVCGPFVRTINIHGLYGIGRTSLVRKLCTHLKESQGLIDKIIWCDLCRDRCTYEMLVDNLLNQICSALHVYVPPVALAANSTNVLLTELLSVPGSVLLVLDDFESLRFSKEAAQSLLETFSRFPSTFKFIVISSAPLLEQVSANLPQTAPFCVGPLEEAVARQLIVRKYIEYRKSDPPEATVNAVWYQSAGIPLVIDCVVWNTLHGTWIDGSSTPSTHDVPEFERTFGEIVERMNDGSRLFWDLMCVADAAGYRLREEVATRVLGSLGIGLQDVSQYPWAIVRDGYIEILQPLKGICRRLQSPAAKTIMLDRLAQHYLGVVSTSLRLRMESYDKKEEYIDLLDEKENLKRALDYLTECAQNKKGELGYHYRLSVYQYTTGLSWFLWMHGLFADRVTYLNEAIDLAVEYQEEADKCIANINDVAWTHFHRGDLDKAEETISRLDAPFLQIAVHSNRRFKAMIDRLRANLLIRRDIGCDQILPLLESARRIFEEIGETRRTASVENEIGDFFFHTGDYGAALDHYREALRISKNIGERHSLPVYYLQIGKALIQLHHHRKEGAQEDHLREACEYLNDGMLAAQDVMRKQVVAHISVALAEAKVEQGRDLQEAQTLLHEAMETFKHLDDGAGLRRVRSLLSRLR